MALHEEQSQAIDLLPGKAEDSRPYSSQSFRFTCLVSSLRPYRVQGHAMWPTWRSLKNIQSLRSSDSAFKVLRVRLLHITLYFELSQNQAQYS